MKIYAPTIANCWALVGISAVRVVHVLMRVNDRLCDLQRYAFRKQFRALGYSNHTINHMLQRLGG